MSKYTFNSKKAKYVQKNFFENFVLKRRRRKLKNCYTLLLVIVSIVLNEMRPTQEKIRKALMVKLSYIHV